MNFLRPLLCLALSVSAATAGVLSWDRPVLEVDATKGQKKIEAEFSFINNSSQPVEIRNIQTSCGCTTAELPQKVYQPGERGTLKAVFTPDGRKGLQKKSIAVRFASEAPPDVLALVVNIPEAFTISPQVLAWRKSSANEPKFFEITPNDPKSSIKSVRAIGKDFEASLEPHEEGKPYRVKVTPLSTDKVTRGKIGIEVADPGKRSIFPIVQVTE
jgi:hypothetical protein